MHTHIQFDYLSPGELRALADFYVALAKIREEEQEKALKDKAECEDIYSRTLRTIEDRVSAANQQCSQAETPQPATTPTTPTTPTGITKPEKPARQPRVKKASDYPPAVIGKGATNEEQLALELAHDKAEAAETCLDTPPAEDKAEETALTIDDVRRYVRSFGQVHGADGLSTLFAKYGAKQLSDIKPEDYAAVVAEVTA